MLDPLKRLEMEEKQRAYIIERFPEFFGNISEKVRPQLGIGVATIPKCWGCDIVYHNNMNPVARPLLSKNEDPLSLKIPDVEDSLMWLFDEIDQYVEAGWKKKQLSLPDLQGPLNVSMKLVGDNRMLSLIARKNKENIVRHILNVSMKTYIEIRKKLAEATNKPIKGNWSVSGCTYYYLRPPQWEKYIIHVIEECQRELGSGIRLHHCGEATAEMMDSYNKIKWNSVEFGFGSDLKHARQIFIHDKLGPVEMSCRISPYRMLNQSAVQITKDVEWIAEQIKGGPASINLVGCPADALEENLRALWNAVRDYNEKKAQEADDDF